MRRLVDDEQSTHIHSVAPSSTTRHGLLFHNLSSATKRRRPDGRHHTKLARPQHSSQHVRRLCRQRGSSVLCGPWANSITSMFYCTPLSNKIYVRLSALLARASAGSGNGIASVLTRPVDNKNDRSEKKNKNEYKLGREILRVSTSLCVCGAAQSIHYSRHPPSPPQNILAWCVQFCSVLFLFFVSFDATEIYEKWVNIFSFCESRQWSLGPAPLLASRLFIWQVRSTGTKTKT